MWILLILPETRPVCGRRFAEEEYPVGGGKNLYMLESNLGKSGEI